MNRLTKNFIITVIAVILTATIYTTPAYADYYSDKIMLYTGIRSNEVANLQNDLKALGYFNYTLTGYFGNITKQAVIKFQSDNGLYVDGIVGRNTSREIKRERVLKTAKSCLGVPYVWGGASPSGFDCSGLTHYVMLKNGFIIPRTAALQYNSGIVVSKNNLRQGSGKIIISSLSNAYFAQRYIGARRIIS